VPRADACRLNGRHIRCPTLLSLWPKVFSSSPLPLGHIDQVAASGAFLATATLLPLVSFDVQLLEGLLVLLALVAKYVMQESREESLQAGHDFWYWLPHCLWHLLVTMGQALLAASIPYFV